MEPFFHVDTEADGGGHKEVAGLIWNLADHAQEDVKQEILAKGVVPLLARHFDNVYYRAALLALSFGDSISHHEIISAGVIAKCKEFLRGESSNADDKNCHFILANVLGDSADSSSDDGGGGSVELLPDTTVFRITCIIEKISRDERLFPIVDPAIGESMSPGEVLYPLERMARNKFNQRRLANRGVIQSLKRLISHPLLTMRDRLSVVRVLIQLSMCGPEVAEFVAENDRFDLLNTLWSVQSIFQMLQHFVYHQTKQTGKIILNRESIQLIGVFMFAGIR